MVDRRIYWMEQAPGAKEHMLLWRLLTGKVVVALFPWAKRRRKRKVLGTRLVATFIVMF